MILYAHSHQKKDPKDWQQLEDHLGDVARRAALFSADFDAEAWGYCLGGLKSCNCPEGGAIRASLPPRERTR